MTQAANAVPLATHHCKPPRPLVIMAAVALAMSEAIADELAAPPNNRPSQEQATDLDLRAPSLHELYTEEQIAALLAKARNEEKGDVEVEGTREPPPPRTPTVWRGIAAPFWALLHPTEAWRILFPMPPDQSRRLQEKPDPSNPEYLPELPPQLPFR